RVSCDVRPTVHARIEATCPTACQVESAESIKLNKEFLSVAPRTTPRAIIPPHLLRPRARSLTYPIDERRVLLRKVVLGGSQRALKEARERDHRTRLTPSRAGVHQPHQVEHQRR